MGNPGNWTGITDASINNRIQEMGERISGIEDMIEEIDSLVKKKTIKVNKVITQSIQD